MADWQHHEWKLLIGGELVAGEAGTKPIVNPATEEVVAEAPEASVAQAEEAARAAQEAFPAWSATPAEERAELLKAAAARLEELGPDLVPLIISETGATATVGSRMQVPVALERFHRYARDATKSIGIPMPPQPVQATPLAPGGLMGALTDLGVSEEEARSYVDDLRRGGVLLVVRAEGMMIERAAAILQRHGAVNIDQRAEY